MGSPLTQNRSAANIVHSALNLARSTTKVLSSTSLVEEIYSFEQLFNMYAKFGDPRSDGTRIALSQSDKWMKQAKMIDGRRLTTTDTGVAFNKFKRRTINYKEYMKFLRDLSQQKNLPMEHILDVLTDAGPPGLTKSDKQTVRASQAAKQSEAGKGSEATETK